MNFFVFILVMVFRTSLIWSWGFSLDFVKFLACHSSNISSALFFLSLLSSWDFNYIYVLEYTIFILYLFSLCEPIYIFSTVYFSSLLISSVATKLLLNPFITMISVLECPFYSFYRFSFSINFFLLIFLNMWTILS